MLSRKSRLFCLLILGLGFWGCARDELLYFTAPSQLAHTRREMKTAGFWISRHPAPDQVMLNSQGIAQFNARVRDELGLVRDLSEFPQIYSGFEFSAELKSHQDRYREGVFYLRNGLKAKEDFFDPVFSNMDLAGIAEQIDVQYGLIAHYADQKFLPTQEALLSKRFDVDFDELQNSALDLGTPVVVLHTSRDGLWVYLVSQRSEGWVKSDKVALCAFEDWHSYMKQHSQEDGFVVVTAGKADVYLQRELTDYYDYVRMGNTFPLVQAGSHSVEVLLPVRQDSGHFMLRSGFLAKNQVGVGYLPFTMRHVFRQAFELLNEPYGWGGMYGEQDCSRLILEVFSPFGIVLPRNSSQQAQVGRRLAQFEKSDSARDKLLVLREVPAQGVALLPMRGHIMLYLGMVDERPYAIHATWAYREPGPRSGEDRIRVINRVAMTDLSLGEGSKKGSLLDRMFSVMVIE